MLSILDYPSKELLGFKELEWTYHQMAKVDGRDETLFAAVYGAYLCSVNDLHSVEALDEYLEKSVSERRCLFVKSMLFGDLSLPVEMNETGKFTKETYENYFRYCSLLDSGIKSEYGTPLSVSVLAACALDIHSGEKISDFGSGVGDFLCYASEGCKEASYYGVDINTSAVEISAIRVEILADDAEIEQGNIFEVDNSRKFDKIFSNYPFAIPMRSVENQGNQVAELLKEIPDLRKGNASDWLFNAQIIKHLSDAGKAVTIMTTGSTWNLNITGIREYFVNKGLIEAVIALPSKLFPYHNVATVIVVLSRGNESVRMIDASDICEKGRRQTDFSKDDIQQIIDLLSEDSEHSVMIDIDTLKKNDYVLNPLRYLDAPIEIKDGVAFGSVIKRITRGAQITAKELDLLVTDEDTGYKYLMLSDIQNGMISDNLKYLDDPDPKYFKYFIGNRNLVLSKNGAPFKVAVAEVGEDEKIIGNGNLFIIELDEKKVNPYYLKAFFDSEMGTMSLQKIAVGAAIPNISAESLKKLIVPVPPIEKQNKIAEAYQAKVDEIKVLRLKLQKAQEAIKNIFEEVD